MSLSIIYSRAQQGINAPLVTIETHLSNGMPSLAIVGLPEAAVRESRHRVRSALMNMHFEFPRRRMTLNLAPADLPKEGGRYDLPIALGILSASGQIPSATLAQYEFIGELALSGELRPVKVVLPTAIQTHSAGRAILLPFANAEEASLVFGLGIFPVKHLTDVYEFLNGQKIIPPYQSNIKQKGAQYHVDLSDICGQKHACRALEIAAAGGHSLLLVGPPGTGKTMIANRLPTILPDMTEKEALESAAITSLSHQRLNLSHWRCRAFRSPHHSASAIALVGGGNPPKPGEISLAHQGVLFLDELPEFKRNVLEALREPLEAGKITISRAAVQSEFPAVFQLVAAMNPCPCGYLGDSEQNCQCTFEQIQRYRSKISGPLLDRIDMHIEMARLPAETLTTRKTDYSESSAVVKKRVQKAVLRQIHRAGKLNSRLSGKEIEKIISLSDAEKKFIEAMMKKRKLSARSYHRLLKIALTITDLAGNDRVCQTALAESYGFRCLDCK